MDEQLIDAYAWLNAAAIMAVLLVGMGVYLGSYLLHWRKKS
jgi:uncharacterized membrane protein